MSSNPYIVQAELLVRDGARGKQAMWVGFRCPITSKLKTMWGSVQNCLGGTEYISTSGPLTIPLRFKQQKEAAGNSVADLYSKKRSKYQSVGLCELHVQTMTISPLRMKASSSDAAQSVGVATKLATPKQPVLPKELTHPEAMGSSKKAAHSWFF